MPFDRSSPRCGQIAEDAATLPSSRRASRMGLPSTKTLASVPTARSGLASALCHIGLIGRIGPIRPIGPIGFRSMIRGHEGRHVRRGAWLAAAEVARGPFAQELREPGFVLDLLVQDRGADGIGAVV